MVEVSKNLIEASLGGKKKSQAKISNGYTTDGHAKEKTSGAHSTSANIGWWLRVSTVKLTEKVRTAHMLMKTTPSSAKDLYSSDANSWTPTVTATIIGAMARIRISITVNHGF